MTVVLDGGYGICTIRLFVREMGIVNDDSIGWWLWVI